MSYLDVPRLHFFGAFSADPSTINNDPTNYELPSPSQEVLSWNPNGSHAWNLVDCTVQTAIGPAGSPLQDPLLGTAVASAATPSTNPSITEPSSPKIVDLDTQQQMVSMIYGLQITIGDSASGTVTGVFQPQPFTYANPQRLVNAPVGTNQVFSACYQSVLENLAWSQSLTSPVLQALQQVSPNALSIKFVVDNFGNFGTPDTPNFQGRITGTIGPALTAAERSGFLIGRLMRPTAASSSSGGSGHGTVELVTRLSAQAASPSYWYTPFLLDSTRNKVVVDFGNSFSTTLPSAGSNTSATSPNPQPVNVGNMELFMSPSQGDPQVLGAVANTAEAYQATAGIQEFDVTTEQISLLQGSVVSVLLNGSPVLSEDQNATFLQVSPMVVRLDPGNSQEIDLLALSFGSPATNQTIGIELNPSILQQGDGPPVGLPINGLQFSGSVTTDDSGQASFTITASPEGPLSPRSSFQGQTLYLDGQVYGISFIWNPALNPDPQTSVSVHAYDAVSVPSSPDWDQDVEPILRPYADLYPYMNNKIKLDYPQALLKDYGAILERLQLPDTDPRYMPVTRDLSTNKRMIVMKWLQQQGPSANGQGGGGQGGSTGS